MKRIITLFLLFILYDNAQGFDGNISFGHEKVMSNGDNVFTTNLHLSETYGIFKPYSNIEYEFDNPKINHKIGIETLLYKDLRLDLGIGFYGNYNISNTYGRLSYSFSSDKK